MRSARRSRRCARRSTSCDARTRSSRPRRCFSRPSSTQTVRSEPLHRGAPRPLRRRADLQDPGVSASAYYQRATASALRGPSRTSGCWSASRSARRQLLRYGYRRMWKALARRRGVGRDRVKRLMRIQGSRAPSAAASRGAPRSPIPRPSGRRIFVKRDFTAPVSRPLVGRGPHAICAAGRPGVLRLRDRRLLPPGRGLAVRRATCAPISSSTRCGWRSPAATPARTSSSCTTPTPAANTPATRSPRSSTTTACWPRSGRSATPTTTRWPKLRRQLQDRAHRRPRLADPHPARAGDRR